MVCTFEINLVSDLKHGSEGIQTEFFKSHCLLYADDIALIGNSEEDLQNMLNILFNWCMKWRMTLNLSKSKRVHFRNVNEEKSHYSFIYGDSELDMVDRYKYLGIVVNEHLDFSVTAAVLAGSAGRALGSLYSKYKLNKGFGYDTYTKLYHSGIVPILDYCSSLWGFCNLDKIDTVQNRAIRLYLGVHKFAPNLSINADMGWIPSKIRRHIEMLRLWNRLLKMEDHRLTKKGFCCDKNLKRFNWCSEIHKILREIQQEIFNYLTPVNIELAKNQLFNNFCEQWPTQALKVSKLNTYNIYKEG